jgi:hypothetical protein
MTSPLLPHARALLASPSTLTVAELDEALGVAQSVHSLRLTAAVAMARDAMPLLASLCTALEASEAEAGRLRAQLAHLTAEAGAESCAAFAAEVNALRAQLAEAGRVALEMSGQTLDWDQEDFYRACLAGQFTTLATIRTEVLK